jgi:hypothetical protein
VVESGGTTSTCRETDARQQIGRVPYSISDTERELIAMHFVNSLKRR